MDNRINELKRRTNAEVSRLAKVDSEEATPSTPDVNGEKRNWSSVVKEAGRKIRTSRVGTGTAAEKVQRKNA